MEWSRAKIGVVTRMDSGAYLLTKNQAICTSCEKTGGNSLFEKPQTAFSAFYKENAT